MVNQIINKGFSDLENSTIYKEYNNTTTKKILFLISIIIMLLILCILSLKTGSLSLTYKQVMNNILSKCFPASFHASSELAQKVVWNIRLPRLLMGFLAGFNLALSGAVMQPALRNPMASSYTLGISSGAGFGATIAIVFGSSFLEGTYVVVITAFIFAILTALIVLTISKLNGSTPEMMILIGVALSSLFGAGITLIKYLADNDTLSEVVFWMVGSLSRATWHNLSYMFPVTLLCVPFVINKAWDLNTMSVGDEVAMSLGSNVEKTRLLLIITASIISAITICFTGTIGFVGLIAPHIARTIVGSDNRFVIIASALVGSLLLICADLIATTIMAPIILPIGVVTAIIGAPLFIYLIIKKKRR